jgi:antitoxin CcdA
MEVEVPVVQSKSALSDGARTRPFAKRAINLSLSADVLDAAKTLQINLLQACDSHLRDVMRREQERRWRSEHADFIVAYNATIESEVLRRRSSPSWRHSTPVAE